MNILRASGLLILVFLLNAFPLRAQQPLKFNIGAVDKSANACQDFYQYACGGWLKQHPIPADRSYRDVYQEMEEINDRRVAEILQLAESAPRNAEQRKVGETTLRAWMKMLSRRKAWRLCSRSSSGLTP